MIGRHGAINGLIEATLKLMVPGVPGGPLIRIVGVAVMGGIEVKRGRPKRSRRTELPSG